MDISNDNFNAPKTELIETIHSGLLRALPPKYQEEREKQAIIEFLQKQGIDCSLEQIVKRPLVIDGELQDGYVVADHGCCFTTKTIHDPEAPLAGPRQFEVEMHLIP